MIPGLTPSVVPSRFLVKADTFDHAVWLNRGANLTGTADNKTATISAWIRNTKVSAEASSIFGGLSTVAGTTARGFNLQLTSAFTVRIFGRNVGDTNILDVSGTAGGAASGVGWVHILASFDMSNTGKRHLYINDASDLATVTTYTNDTIDHTAADYYVGGVGSGANKVTGDMAEIWWHNSYMDLSVVANRRKFITAAKKPVYLGASGELPLGTAPLVYLSGPAASFATNKGTGGGFTVNTSTLADASSSPSD